MTTQSYLTPNRHGYSVRFNPYSVDHLVVATSQYYGLTGGGTLFFLEQNGDTLKETHAFQWSDGLFDVVWSLQDPELVVTASGDGGLQLWRTPSSSDIFRFNYQQASAPVTTFQEHTKEVYSVDWHKTRENFLSASWDGGVKLWDPLRTKSISTFQDSSQLVYNAMFSPFIADTFSSVGSDGVFKLWSTLHSQPIASIKAHEAEVLTCDWSKISENILATGASDGLIRGWDVRNFGLPLFELSGCEFAVRRIQFSPFEATVLASVAYDFTTRLWDFDHKTEALETIRHHSEFTYGLDWNRLRQNELADCGWDSLVHVFTPKCLRD